MSEVAALASRSWRVGERTVTLTMRRPIEGALLHSAAEWSPNEPTKLSTEEWRQYRAGRNAAIEELAVALNVSVAVVEL